MSAIESSVSPISPSVAFAQEPDNRIQDLDITPLSEAKKVSDAITDDEEEQESEAKSKSKRNSIVAFVDSFRSLSRTTTRNDDGSSIPIDRTTTQNSVASAKSNSSRRSSKSRPLSWIRRSSIEEQEVDNGPYADVVRAQNEFMEKIRADQERRKATHNSDGIPLPPRKSSSRRSSIVQILGFDKPMLAF
ncbi:hypothetical protein BGZ46_000849 [Entomortierella lignicola]|nr:hypothetical protein BGZ46_000849 [Entomortierella lignicola]